MEAAVSGVRQVMRTAGIAGICQVDTRECETCGKDVPVMERTDREGVKHIESMCLACETDKTRSRFPKKEDLLREKAKGFSVKYEQVPKKLVGKTVAGFKSENDAEKAMKQAAADYIVNFGKTEHHSLLMAGPMGLGKSHLAYAIGAELRRQGYSTMFIAADDFLRLIKETFERGTDLSERTIFEMIEQVDLLIFDEIGAEYNNQKGEFESWASEKILKVVDLREDLPTIFTTNYSPADFEKKYGRTQGGRIVSRMMAGAKKIKVEGRDRRESDF